jgi:regulator of replication initiation timing
MLTDNQKLRLENIELKQQLLKKEVEKLALEQKELVESIASEYDKTLDDIISINYHNGEILFKEIDNV